MRTKRGLKAKYSDDSSPSEVKMSIECMLKNYNVYFKSDHVRLSQPAEALVATVSFPCLFNGMFYDNGALVSRRFKNGLKDIIHTIRKWGWSKEGGSFENLREREDYSPQGKRIGSFFSGGVDSFYTLLKHRDEITDLIFVHGFDIPLSDHGFRKEVSDFLKKAAGVFEKNLIEIETNLRRFLDRHVGWTECHGAALATVAHVVSNHFRKIYIPSTYGYEDLFPWGTHPDLDSNWSSDQIELIHDGCESNRFKKIGHIIKNDVALKTLRVCFENRDGAYNCGKCGKCIRTMVMLKAWGLKGHPETFSTPLSLEAVKRMKMPDRSDRVIAINVLNELKKSGGFPEYVKAMEYALTQKHSFWTFKRNSLEFLRRIKKTLLRSKL